MNIRAKLNHFLQRPEKILFALFLFWILGLLIPSHTTLAQNAIQGDTTDSASPINQLPADTLNTPAQPDSLAQSAEGPQGGSAGITPSEDAVHFQASDSLTFTFGEEREGTLYGDSKVDHTAGKLESGIISLNLDQNLMEAKAESPEDTLSHPVLTNEQERIRSERILFNYQTERGKFNAARVSIQQGVLTGGQVKNKNRSEVYIKDGIYSTCTLNHPHYYLKADKMKVVDEEEIFFTRARLYLLDIPYPLVLPFGYVPAKIEKRRSGLLEPTYAFQNQGRRGIGLQNLGWFQNINPYMTAQASFDLFTSGTFFANTNVRYRMRHKFSGNVKLSYSRDQGLEPTDPNFNRRVNKQLMVSHSQDISPYASVTANVNLRTADFYKRNSYDPDERAETSTNSKLSYNYGHPDNFYNFSVSMQQSQNFANNVTTLTGPNLSFNTKTFSPFKTNSRSQDPRFYETLSLSYNNSFRSRFQYDPIDADSATVDWWDALWNPSQYRQATDELRHVQYGFNQSVRMNMKLIPGQYVQVNASARANEYWYPATIRQVYDAQEDQIKQRLEQGFTTGRDFSTSLSANTTLYGIWNQSIGSLKGFRHTMRPSISYNYRPDFSTDFWGYYRDVPNDTTGRKYSIFSGGIIGGPGSGESQSIGLSLGNILETKQVKRDTTGETKERTIRIIDNLNMNTSYNFAAESFNLGNLSMNMNSSIVRDVSISSNATFSFYQTDENGARIDRYLWEDEARFARLTSFSLSASTRFDGGSQRGWQTSTPEYPEVYDPLNQQAFHPIDPHYNTQPIQRFNTPLSFNLSFSYRWDYVGGSENNKSAILNARNINFNLTPKWSFRTSLGYDFIAKELTPSQFSLNRSLHCWNLSFQMNPFGEFKYYLFRLSVNDSQIQGLLQKLPVLKNLERSSSTINRF